jgi:2-polyprenyl-6-methoxyphenol hydroxylase-like FAD-dependent oxidoreductase
VSEATVPPRVPVLVAGGGPSGLAAALELGRRGVEVLVVEPRTVLDPLRPRAKTTSVRTMEHLRRWGLADRLRAAAPLPVAHAQDVVFCTGLFGHEITRFPEAFGLWTRPRPIAAEAGQQAPQPDV